MARDQDGLDKEESLPFYAAGCYPIPIRFLYGTAAEISFWDLVCFRAYRSGGAFDTSTEELVDQTGLSRQVLGQLRRQAIDQGDLIEQVSWVSGRRFVLQPPSFDPSAHGIIWKPQGYVHNGWHRVVVPAIPKRVLNLYLQQPRQRIYHLDMAYIASRCKRRFLYSRSTPAAPLNSADVGKALRLLVRLGLLAPEEDGYRIDWGTFNQPAPSPPPPFDAADPADHPVFRQANNVDPGRARRALELLDIGQYEMETHFAEIFRDLAYVRSEDYALLKTKAYRYRNRPPGSRRWHDTWKAFQYELKRRVAEIRAPKSVLNLSESALANCALALDLPTGKQVLDVRMVSRVEWPWCLQEKTEVGLELRSGAQILLTRTVDSGDEVRHAFRPDQWPGGTTPLVLHAWCDQPLPGLHVEAWLEARLRI